MPALPKRSHDFWFGYNTAKKNARETNRQNVRVGKVGGDNKPVVVIDKKGNVVKNKKW